MVTPSLTAPQANFWRDKRVLLTGHTGFKGGWLALWLHRLGAKVTGLSLPPSTTPNLYTVARIAELMDSHFCDIRDAEKTAAIVRAARPDVLFHLAAQPLVRTSYQDPLSTYHTNTLGTAHVLDALRGLDCIKVAVMVTTDKVYRPAQSPYPYRETDPLGGHDPYSASKAASEIIIESYRNAYLQAQGVAVASARAGNVIGGGDWSEDRLIPDAVRAWQQGKTLAIRRPDAVRPWQHVLEPLYGYLRLAERLWQAPELADAYNFGPKTHEAATVRTVIQIAQRSCTNSKTCYDDVTQGPHEAAWLALETAAARRVLGQKPVWSLNEAVQRSMQWYQAQFQGRDAQALCDADIQAFLESST